MTNREWLETLSDNELLKVIYICCVAMNGGECPEGMTCRGCQIKWLNDEHRDGNNDK